MAKRNLPALMAAAAVMGLLAAVPAYAKDITFPEGLYVGSQSLEGMTETEAAQVLEELTEKMAESPVTLLISGTAVHTTARELGFTWENRDVLSEAADRIAGGNLIRQYMKRRDLEKEPVHLALQAAVTAEGVRDFVDTHCSELIRQPQNAAITRRDGEFIITPEEEGLAVDAAATAERINEALVSLTQDNASGGIRADAVLTERQPDIRADMLASIQDVLGTFSTDFSSSGQARSANIKNGAGKLDGILLMPGETLSGYERMHPFTTENGYFTAAGYENGQVVDSIGGGVCQIATTLYNAALEAELTITQRQNHSMIVGYVKPSMDAAIAGTYKDIKITNNYSTPIYVEGHVSGRTLSFTIYGNETRPENRKVEYVSETLETMDPGAPERREDKSLAPGTVRQVQSAHIGRRSRLWKVVTVDGAETERTLLHEDTYNPARAIILVGPSLPEPAETEPAETEPAVPETTAPEPAAPVQSPSNAGPGGSP